MGRRLRPAGMRATLAVSYLVLLGIAMLIIFIAVRLTAPDFFDSHIAAMSGMRHGQPGAMMVAESEELNRAMARSLNEGFLLAGGITVPLALVASFLVARQISAPLGRLARATRRLSLGDYGERVEEAGPLEVRELARNFNVMAQALEGAEERRAKLIGDVAHELRTPLAVLQGYAEGLADGVVQPSEATWSRLQAETGRLKRLVEDLAELSRAEAGQLAVAVAEVGVAAAIEASIAGLRPAFERKGVTLRVDTADAPARVRADHDRLVQVLTNLLTNALNYTPAGGTVTVSAGRQGSAALFAVRDTGIGIPSEHLQHLFERFYRVDRSRARSSGGSGVGLTIARALVEAMGGRIEAHSEGPGKGAVFTFTLPVSGPAA